MSSVPVDAVSIVGDKNNIICEQDIAARIISCEPYVSNAIGSTVLYTKFYKYSRQLIIERVCVGVCLGTRMAVLHA